MRRWRANVCHARRAIEKVDALPHSFVHGRDALILRRMSQHRAGVGTTRRGHGAKQGTPRPPPQTHHPAATRRNRGQTRSGPCARACAAAAVQPSVVAARGHKVRHVACGAQEFTTEDAKGDDTGLGKVANVKVTTRHQPSARRCSVRSVRRTKPCEMKVPCKLL